MMKPKPCTLAEKHSWQFIKNVTLTTATFTPKGSSAHIRFRGLYRCACGQTRHGTQQDQKASTT